MWSDDERTTNFVNSLICPKCNSHAYLQNPRVHQFKKCDECDQIKKIVHCSQCDVKYNLCIFCEYKKKNNSKAPGRGTEKGNKTIIFIFLLLGMSIILYFIKDFFTKSTENINKKTIERLRKDFPSQRNETWYDFLSMLDKRTPSVKSITFLRSKDLRTSVCLTKTLVSLYKGDENFDLEEITFSPTGFETKDYGFALEHYHHIVKKYGVFITDLNNVPEKIARIFHSLCDEVSSDIKPSRFIFTLKYENTSAKLKPIERATTTLKKVWSNLPESELNPLLSRIVKNVVDVIPEEQLKC